MAFLPQIGTKIFFSVGIAVWLTICLLAIHSHASTPSLVKGDPLLNARVVGTEGNPIELNSLKGRVKILSMVPQLNTPVCDDQTHRFSEKNEGLDQYLDIVTISTNTAQDQAQFAEKANIHNLTFLSDSPEFDFGKKTGLLLPNQGILHRAVVVADSDNVIRYIELVPMSQLPNFERAFDAARSVLKYREQ
ncbi:MAG: redoxin domain-containing protein [Nitrospirales bacterium]|nr:redoxin domain-containing protein [Nitrospirales bacterium]